MKASAEAAKRRRRLGEVAASLPEVTVSGVGPPGRPDQHLAIKVRQKTFAYYLFDHHGDGRVALCCKGAPGEQGRLVEDDPRRFFVPPYLGPRGWVALRLDTPRVNWAEVAHLLRTAYRLTAPRTLAARLE